MKEDLGDVTAPGTLRFERLLPVGIHRAWAHLVEPELRAHWLAGGAMGTQPGDAFELLFDHTALSGEQAPERFKQFRAPVSQASRVLQMEEPQLLVLAWRSDANGPAASEARFELTAQGDKQTALHLTHSGLRGVAETRDVAAGWHAHLGVLLDVLHGRIPRPFWSHLDKVAAEYEASITE
ncbi:SRPBCC domain-containing protein [Variovorax sp. dw_308]|uniref:SRPBCC domain-containing protein n=1 Tax=Variovorax sp. dw_308 TaxID=2721546 RepID=UPI001C477A12|nr:SRPBCC domain-containing protein [Variovorax sp. dw_308]